MNRIESGSHPPGVETVDSLLAIGLSSSMVLDKAGKVYAVYYDATNERLKYADNTTGSWQRTVIDLDKGAGGENAMAIDHAGTIHVAYTVTPDLSHWSIKYLALCPGR